MNEVPFLNFKKSIIKQKEILDRAWNRVLDSGHFILGQEVLNFEKKFSQYTHSSWALGCANGTDAIELALRALKIGRGDEVITTPLTAMPTLMGIAATGATIKLADVSLDSGLIDPLEIKKQINSKTKALVPVHLYGQICQMDEILKISSESQLKVIEDCAQSLGATWNNKSAGSWGDLASWSFYPTKNLGALGDAGAVTSNNHEYESLIKALRNYGQSKLYHHDYYGRNSRLDELQAAILSARLDIISDELKRRIEIGRVYTEAFKGKLKIITDPFRECAGSPCFHLFVIATPFARNEFQAKLKELGIGSLVHYPIPAHKQMAFKDLGYQPGDFKNSEWLADQVLSLPLHAYMEDSEVEMVINAVLKLV